MPTVVELFILPAMLHQPSILFVWKETNTLTQEDLIISAQLPMEP